MRRLSARDRLELDLAVGTMGYFTARYLPRFHAWDAVFARRRQARPAWRRVLATALIAMAGTYAIERHKREHPELYDDEGNRILTCELPPRP